MGRTFLSDAFDLDLDLDVDVDLEFSRTDIKASNIPNAAGECKSETPNLSIT